MTNLFALLIGINEWHPESRVRGLRGCLNDNDAVLSFLREHMSVPEGHIKVLRDADATRHNIIATFRAHLIENPAIERDDQILIHYSGHGARVRDLQGIEPDGYHESLVTYDSRLPGKCDLLDKELGELLDELAAAKGSNITLILDSCHSGSGARDIPVDESAPLTRQIDPDERPLPPEVAAKMAKYAGTSRSVTPSLSGWTESEMPYVLLAGCRDEQLSREYEGAPGVWNGALTYFTLDCLKRRPAGATYSDLYEEVAARVNGIYRSQEPQCEGQRLREIFGGLTVERYPFLRVTAVAGNTVQLNGGIVHDLHPGTELLLYTPDLNNREQLKENNPLAKVRVTTVAATTATAELVDDGDVRAQAVIPDRARAVITAHAFNPNEQKVALLSDGKPESEDAIANLRATLEGESSRRKLVSLAEVSANPPLLVKAIAGQYHIYDGDGNLLVEPVDFARAAPDGSESVGASRARDALEAIARYRAVLNLKNEESAQWDALVTVSLHEVLPGGRTIAPESQPTHADGAIALGYDPNGSPKAYAVQIRNQIGEPMFANVFLLTSDFGIYRLFPNKGQNDTITDVFTVGIPPSRERPLGVRLEPHQISSTEYLKVVLTPDPTEMGGLVQEPLAVPDAKSVRSVNSFLDNILDATLGERGLFQTTADDEGRPWVVLTVPVRIVRDGDTALLPVGETTVPLPEEAGGMTLEKPASFTGSIKVTTIEQEARALGDVPLLPIPASLLQSGYRMVERPGARATDPARIVLEISPEGDAGNSISPTSPLKLHLGALAERDDEIIPVYFDGENFLPAGYAEGGETVVLTHLPPPSALPPSDDEVAARGLFNAVKLFIFHKKLGRKEKSLGLHAVEVIEHSDGRVEVTRKPLPKSFKRGARVCLFVHGFTSDSESIVPAPYKMLREAGKTYDHYLSYDYESLGTSVRNNAKNLADALRRECSFHQDDGVTLHIIAHSMGGFTTRHLIQGEETRGHEFVDKVILAGAPNEGTTLATLANGTFWIAAFLLNHVPGIPFGSALGDLLGGFHEELEGLQDLRTGSDAVQELRAMGALPIPFLVLTGTNNPAEESRWRALAHKVTDATLDQIFGEENDAVIGISSLRAIGIHSDSNLRIPDALPCNHSAYFNLPQVWELARDFL